MRKCQIRAQEEHEAKMKPIKEKAALRDHFAGLAMQAIIKKAPLMKRNEVGASRQDESMEGIAKGAYRYADAMLEERRK